MNYLAQIADGDTIAGAVERQQQHRQQLHDAECDDERHRVVPIAGGEYSQFTFRVEVLQIRRIDIRERSRIDEEENQSESIDPDALLDGSDCMTQFVDNACDDDRQ